MTPAWRGFILGVALALAGWLLLGGGTSADLYARVGPGGRYLLDARLDESAVGRLTNIPAATLGEVTLSKRSWLLVTSYQFALRLRPDVAPDAAALRSLEVSVRLPGRVVATNAARVSAGTAMWEGLTGEALVLRTRSVHWLRVAVLALILVAAVVFGRR